MDIDRDFDGVIDRWDTSGPRARSRGRYSRANDGKADAWAYQGAGARWRASRSPRAATHGEPHRVYEAGSLARAEEDSDGDGTPDKWRPTAPARSRRRVRHHQTAARSRLSTDPAGKAQKLR